MKLTLALCLIAFSSASLAQSRASISVATPAPTKRTVDEYGLPLKQKETSAAPNQAVLSGMQSEAGTPAPAAKPTSKPRIAKRKSTPKKKSMKAPEAVAPDVLEKQAVKELMLPKEDLSSGVLPTPATVRSRIETVENPIRPLKYRLGVSLQPFTPKGSMPVSGLVAYDLADVGTGAMVAIDGQWLPFSFENVAGLKAGAFVSVGYSQFNLALRSPTGVQIEDTKLHAIKAQIGATTSYQLPQSPLWSLHGNVGVGRLQMIQSSSVSFANTSSAMNFASLGLAGERSLTPNFSAYAAYDLRIALSRVNEGADVPNHNVLLGFLGNFE